MSAILWLIGINILAWLLIHLIISYTCFKLGERPFLNESWLTKQRIWESHGSMYEMFGIKRWKLLLPDGGSFYKGDFRKKQLQGYEAHYLKKFILETRRAEWTHWLAIPPSLLFFLWNTWYVGVIMIVYAFMFNVPFIMIQRYNRIRLKRLYKRMLFQ
jgi:glycosyl-4,4'-diaponeurosporenoate acyltransferase